MRDTCPNRDRCGKTGHYFKPGEGYVRCTCLEQELLKKDLGPFFTPEPALNTPMMAMTDRNCLIEGQLSGLKKHIAGVMIKFKEAGKTVRVMDAYRLIEIFLEKDTEFASTTASIDADLLILLLGFGDPRNKYLPELVIQAIERRSISNQPNWVILGIEPSQIAGRYSTELAQRLLAFKKVSAK